MTKKPRYHPEREFPPYAFIPGKHPHPIRDPKGHLHNAPHEEFIPLGAENWSGHPQYLYGIDLLNHGFWWEAHEFLEGLWKITDDAELKNHLKALIQAGAILVNLQLGEHKKGAVGNLRVSIFELASNLPEPFLGVSWKSAMEEIDGCICFEKSGITLQLSGV